MIETDPNTAAQARLPFQPLPRYQAIPTSEEMADCRGKRIGILIVTYNAVSTLVPVLRRIPPVVWQNVEEVVVFDDASQDATFELAVGLKATCELAKLTVMKNPKNLGYGGNQKAGYRYFIDKGFDVVVLLHGDGQYAPEILAHLYHPIVSGAADAVFGSRMMKTYGGPLKGGMPLYKFVGNRILTFIENKALGLNLTEFHSGYRAYNLHGLRHIDFSSMTDDFHFDTEIIVKLDHQHFCISEVPIPTYYGDELCYVDGLKYARNVLKSVWRYKRTVRSLFRAPEYAEYFVHYPIKEMKYSSHYWAKRLVGHNQDVLDIGAGEGFLAAQLNKDGNRVTGVDVLPEPANRSAFEEYYSADLEGGLGGVLQRLRGRRFSRVLMLDVLEHVRDPKQILMEGQAAIQDTGRLILTVPNIANISVRLMLLFGKFDYTERGILDRTHVRFFTRKTARTLLEDTGWEILEERMSVIPLELVIGLSPVGKLMRALNFLLAGATDIFRGLLGYQIIFVARKKTPRVSPERPPS